MALMVSRERGQSLRFAYEGLVARLRVDAIEKNAAAFSLESATGARSFFLKENERMSVTLGLDFVLELNKVATNRISLVIIAPPSIKVMREDL